MFGDEKMTEDNLYLQKLLSKILNKKIVDKFHNKLKENNINHTELSIKSGKNPTAFNKTFNNGEQLTLISFLRYWYSASSLKNVSFNTASFSIEEFIQPEELELLRMICLVKDYNLDSLEYNDIKFLKHLKYYYDLLKANKKLSAQEIQIYEKIYNIVI